MTKNETNINIIQEGDKATFKLDRYEGGAHKESKKYIVGPAASAILQLLLESLIVAYNEQKQLNHEHTQQ
jgi:hypothetical protein